MISIKHFTAAALAVAAASLVATAQAATTTTTFHATITITESCSFSATSDDVAFGSVARSSTKNATGNLYVTCSTGTPYAIALDNGSNGTGNITATSRLMKNGTLSVPYGLYADNGYANLWGDGTNSTVTKSGTGTATQQTIPVYGQVTTAATNVAAGTYTDIVTATLTY